MIRGYDRAQFDHVGLVTEEVRGRETFVESTRCWVTSPREHPFNVEWLRYEPDTPVTGKLRHEPHVAYRVSDIHEALAACEGCEVLIPPMEVGGGFATVAFVDVDGLVVEFMQYRNPEETGVFRK